MFLKLKTADFSRFNSQEQMLWPHTKRRQCKILPQWATLEPYWFSRGTEQTQGAKIVSHIYHEMSLHVDFCKGFGVSREEMEACEESQGNLAPLGASAVLIIPSMHCIH
jgi:hypothetical protein